MRFNLGGWDTTIPMSTTLLLSYATWRSLQWKHATSADSSPRTTSTQWKSETQAIQSRRLTGLNLFWRGGGGGDILFVVAIGDHDFTKLKLIPLVCPHLWYSRGDFQQFLRSWRHRRKPPSSLVLLFIMLLSWCLTWRQGVKTNRRHGLLLYKDGGPDHRLIFRAVKDGSSSLFRKLNLDNSIAARTYSMQSWNNLAAPCMSLHKGLQSIGFNAGWDVARGYVDSFRSLLHANQSYQNYNEMLPIDHMSHCSVTVCVLDYSNDSQVAQAAQVSGPSEGKVSTRSKDTEGFSFLRTCLLYLKYTTALSSNA